MRKEDYKRLNDYLNDAFIYLSKYDGFFIQNMHMIFPLNSILYENLKGIDLRHNFHKNNLTHEYIFELARNEIENINPNYLENFDKLIDSGRLEFFLHEQNMIIKESTYYENLSEIENNEEEIRNDSVCSYNNGDYFIDLARTHNYNDVLMLIHEFIHSTNSSKNMGEYRYILTEFFSIYFEMLSQKDLLEKGINPGELDIFDRIKSAGKISKKINKYDLVFMAYNLFGNVKEDSYEDLEKYHIVSSTKEDFEDVCINLLKYFDYQKIVYNNENKEFNLYNYRKHISRMFSSGYRYLYGTLFACHLLENGNKDKIVWLNDHINDEEIKNMDLTDVLKIIGIDLTDENIDVKLVDSAQNYYENLSKYSVKEEKEKSLTYNV
jgi:hypothetical protein